jgi:hypothetical protein
MRRLTMATMNCVCGRSATTEIQIGWDRTANGGAGGGVYEPLCDECYAETPEAAAHRRRYGEIVQAVEAGLYRREICHGHIRWTHRDGQFHDEETHRRLLVDPYGIHG